MKTKLLSFLLGLGVVTNSYSQPDPCPGTLNVYSADDISVGCNGVGQIDFNVYLDAPNSSVSYVHGPTDADCYILPSGWSFVKSYLTGTVTIGGQAKEKYIITLHTSASTSGQGQVRNKSNCGTQTTTYSAYVSFNISRPVQVGRTLDISGNLTICDGSTVSYTLNNPQPGDSFGWTTSNNLSVTGSYNSSTVQVTKNGSGGPGFVKLYVGDACNNPINKVVDVFAGAPNLQQMTYGTDGSGVNNTVYQVNTVSPYTWYVVRTNENSGSVTWNVNNSINGYASGPYEYRFNLNQNQNFTFFPITASNDCGSASRYPSFTTSSSYRMSPNPATTDLQVTFDNTDFIEALPEQLDLLSEESTKPVRSVKIKDLFENKDFKSKKSLNFNIADLPRGTYYLHVIDSKKKDKQVESTRIVIE